MKNKMSINIQICLPPTEGWEDNVQREIKSKQLIERIIREHYPGWEWDYTSQSFFREGSIPYVRSIIEKWVDLTDKILILKLNKINRHLEITIDNIVLASFLPPYLRECEMVLLALSQRLGIPFKEETTHDTETTSPEEK